MEASTFHYVKLKRETVRTHATKFYHFYQLIPIIACITHNYCLMDVTLLEILEFFWPCTY